MRFRDPVRVRGYPAAVGALLASYFGLLAWDVSRYDWLRGYDAYAASLYVDSIQLHHVLPGKAATDVWHNPPLFYALAALIQPHVGWTGLEPHKAVQLLSVVCGVGVVVFAFLIARELFPRSRSIQLGTLAAAALTPVLVRGSLMYHPEPLATLLATAGLYVAVRAAARRWTLVLGALAGLLLGLGNLTRTWALAEAVAVVAVVAVWWLRMRDRAILRFLAGFAAVFLAVSVPWYARQTIKYGSPFAFSKPDPAQWKRSGRPLAFFTALRLGDVFSNPYQPTYSNVLLPVTYADWWGDYSRYFHVPLAEVNDPPKLESRYRVPLVEQSIVGIVPTLLALAGIVALGVVAIRARRPSLGIAVAAALGVAVAFVGFLIRYPKQDGDNLKALYVLDLVPIVAVCIAWTVDWVRRRADRFILAGLLLWLAATGAYDVNFLVLR
jgi:4-amino-4-deoxy-L-arabinose transferase-like glycosyltransferase